LWSSELKTKESFLHVVLLYHLLQTTLNVGFAVGSRIHHLLAFLLQRRQKLNHLQSFELPGDAVAEVPRLHRTDPDQQTCERLRDQTLLKSICAVLVEQISNH